MPLALLILALLQPSEAPRLYRQALALLDANNPSAAIPLLEQATQLDPANALYFKTAGVAYARLADYRAALAPFRRACQLDPALADACYYAGRALYAADLYDQALAPLQLALKHDPAKARAETALAQCHEALGNAAQAERLFKQALARADPHLQQARLAYARFLVRQGRAAHAVPIARQAQSPESAEARFELALALSQSDNLKEAIEALDRALALNPGYEEAFTLRAKLRARLTAPPPPPSPGPPPRP